MAIFIESIVFFNKVCKTYYGEKHILITGISNRYQIYIPIIYLSLIELRQYGGIGFNVMELFCNYLISKVNSTDKFKILLHLLESYDLFNPLRNTIIKGPNLEYFFKLTLDYKYNKMASIFGKSSECQNIEYMGSVYPNYIIAAEKNNIYIADTLFYQSTKYETEEDIIKLYHLGLKNAAHYMAKKNNIEHKLDELNKIHYRAATDICCIGYDEILGTYKICSSTGCHHISENYFNSIKNGKCPLCRNEIDHRLYTTYNELSEPKKQSKESPDFSQESVKSS